jgi:hypothetical protein
MLIEKLGHIAYRVDTSSTVASHLISPSIDQRGPDPAINGRLFRQNTLALLNELTQYWHNRLANNNNNNNVSHPYESTPLDDKAMVIPALQIAPVGIRQDVTLLNSLLHYLNTSNVDWQATLASGYFNLHDTISRQILNTQHTNWQLLVAAPEVSESISSY